MKVAYILDTLLFYIEIEKLIRKIGNLLIFCMFVAGIILFIRECYKYTLFRQTHTLAEAIITDHTWDDNHHFVLSYKYNLSGMIYEG